MSWGRTCQLAWERVVGIALLGLLASCQACTETPEASVRDVIPARHLTADGRIAEAQDGMQELYVFPSTGGTEAGEVEFRMTDLLRGSRLEERLCFDICSLRECACPGNQLFITVDQELDDAVLKIGVPSLQKIRSLTWLDFRKLQGRFARWLWSRGVSWREDQLRAFWHTALRTAQVPPVPRSAPIPSRKPTNSSPATQGFPGNVPLVPGMRLVVQWGGTAVYPRTITDAPLTRHTVTGSTVLPVLARENQVTLAVPPFLGGTTDGKASWPLDTKTPKSWPADPQNVDDLPFNDSKFVPVFNELDLRVIPLSAPSWTLHVPFEFSKPDFASDAEQGTPRTTTDALGEYDAFQETDVSTSADAQYQGHPRRYALSGGKCPLLFANQTSVSVEVGASVGRNSARFVPLGFTWGDLVDTYEPWIRLQGMSDSSWELMRRTPLASPVRYRLRIDSIDDLHAIEVHPGDTLIPR